jgi:hypothetical protein
MRHKNLIIYFCCFIAGSRTLASQKTFNYGAQVRQDANNVIQINVGDITSLLELPSVQLMRAVHRFPKATTFRVSWISGFGSSSTKGTALYNRSQKNIRVFSQVQMRSSTYSNHYLYRNITDQEIEKLAYFNKGTGTGDQTGNFSNLTRFGVKLTSHQQVKKSK